jgi:hypothetical protein
MATTRIDSITPPPIALRGKALTVAIRVSTVEYPDTVASPTDATAHVRLTVALPSGDKSYNGVFVRPGQYLVNVPASDTEALAAGRYTIIAESQLHSETPSVESSAILLF